MRWFGASQSARQQFERFYEHTIGTVFGYFVRRTAGDRQLALFVYTRPGSLSREFDHPAEPWLSRRGTGQAPRDSR